MSKFERGLFTDCSETDQPEGTYRFARNIIDSNVLGVKENEDGFIPFGTITPYTVIGIIPVGQDFVVFSTDNTNSEIGKVVRTPGTLTYTPVYNDPLLNFNTAYPIDGEFRKDVNGERVVAWTDNFNPPRILDIDNLTGINDINDLNIFQTIQNPAIQTSSINDTGGSLTTGAIIIFTRYRNKDGSETNIFVHDHVFYINDDPKSEAFNLVDGALPGTISNKSITVTLQNCDTHFDTLVVGYLQSINGILTAKTALTLTNATTVTFTLTGSEASTDTTLDEVLTAKTNYNTAKTITQLSGGLVLANLVADDLPDLQLSAMSIVINYNLDLINVLSNTNSHKDNIPPSLMPGEVYAFYLGVELNKGGWGFYHIPGRPVFTGNELDFIATGNLSYTRYQVDNTTNSGAASNLGYWQNSAELYPNNAIYGSFANTPVRHHRMPTVDYLVSTTYSGDPNVGIITLPRIGITASNVNIPAPIQAKIKRWKIFFAKKNEDTALVMGSDLAMFTTGSTADANIKWSSAGNWAINAVGTDPLPDFIPFQKTSMRGHSLDMLYKNTSVVPSYARFNYQLKRQNLNQTYTGFGSSGARLTISGKQDGTCSSAVIDYTVPSSTTRTNAGFIKSFDTFTYLPPNAIINNFKSLYNEGAFVMDIHNPSTAFDSIIPILLETRSAFVDSVFNQFSTYIAPDPNPGEMTMYMQYYRYLTDVHVSFLQQDLIPFDGYASPSSTSQSFYGGDTFLCYMSFLTMTPLTSSPNTDLGQPSIEGVRIWRGYIGYSRNNWNYRFQEVGKIGTFYHGKTDVRNLFSPTGADASDSRSYTSLIDANQTHNIIDYDPSSSTQNIFTVGTIFDPTKVRETKFPNTVIWSNLQPVDSKEFSWRTFPSGNRYVIPKGKGDIVNVQGWHNKDLIIHTEHSFFKTRTDIKIAAESENVFFKSVNLFDLPPEELIPTATGYGGTQNRFGCYLTKVGYVFVNDLQGKVFIFNGESLEEISTNGLRIFFRDFMGIKDSNLDNPFNSNGYTIGYDEKINRLLITKTFGSLSWTISYNPSDNRKYWVSYHSYIPDYMFNTVDGTLYSIKGNKFYAHNARTESTTKGLYYNLTPDPSYIDIVHNEEHTEDKLITGLEWVTEVYPNSYINGQPNSTLDYTTTVTHLTLRSQQHCTGRIPVSLYSNFDDLYTNNIRNLNRTWYFNEIRDITLQTGFTLGFYNNFDLDLTKLNTNMEWHEQRKFIDKFVICRYEYDNQINNRFLFLESKANYRHADR